MKDWARRSVLVVSAYIDRRSCSNECFLQQCKLCGRASTKLTSTCLSPGWAVEMPRVKCCICGTYSFSNFRSSAGWNKHLFLLFFFWWGVVEAKFTKHMYACAKDTPWYPYCNSLKWNCSLPDTKAKNKQLGKCENSRHCLLKKMSMYRNNMSSQDNSHTLSEKLQKLSYLNIIESKPVAENCWLHLMQK